MFLLAIQMLLAASADAPVPIKEQFWNAIVFDLQHNAMVGTGAWNASLWYQAAAEEPEKRTIYIRGLNCRPKRQDRRCAFTLFREGGDVKFEGELSPASLSCTALFRHYNDDNGVAWGVFLKPASRKHSHTQTSMNCRATTQS